MVSHLQTVGFSFWVVVLLCPVLNDRKNWENKHKMNFAQLNSLNKVVLSLKVAGYNCIRRQKMDLMLSHVEENQD